MFPTFYVLDLGHPETLTTPKPVEFLAPSMSFGSNDHGGTVMSLEREHVVSLLGQGDIPLFVATGRRGFYSVFQQKIAAIDAGLEPACLVRGERKTEKDRISSIEAFWILKPGSGIEVSFADGVVCAIRNEEGALWVEIIQTAAVAHEAYSRLAAEKRVEQAHVLDLPDGASLEHALIKVERPMRGDAKPPRYGDQIPNKKKAPKLKAPKKPRAKKKAA